MEMWDFYGAGDRKTVDSDYSTILYNFEQKRMKGHTLIIIGDIGRYLSDAVEKFKRHVIEKHGAEVEETELYEKYVEETTVNLFGGKFLTIKLK